MVTLDHLLTSQVQVNDPKLLAGDGGVLPNLDLYLRDFCDTDEALETSSFPQYCWQNTTYCLNLMQPLSNHSWCPLSKPR